VLRLEFDFLDVVVAADYGAHAPLSDVRALSSER